MQKIKNPHLGYYSVGNKIFRDRVSAILESTSDKKHHVQWHFNNEEFSKYDWRIEPTESLDELYKARALQLRNNHDYLVLQWSGGSDSNNILQTFIKNKIHLDEILVYWPRELTKNLYYPNTQDQSGDNVWSEWDYVIEPGIRYLLTNHPEIKITIDDWSNTLNEYAKHYNDEWFVGRSLLSPLGHHRFKNFSRLYDGFKKTGFICGVDKPNLMYKNNKYFCYFVDTSNVSVVGVIPPWVDNDDIKREFFYWSPECVPLIIKQSHTVKNFFHNHPEFLHLIDGHFKKDSTDYHNLLKPLLYPGWKYVFQSGKENTKERIDRTIMKVFPKELIKNYYSGYQEILSIVDQKYIDRNTNGLTGFVSQMYEL